jgi:hypothetical protein
MGRQVTGPARRVVRVTGTVVVVVAASVAGAYLLLPLAVHAFIRGLDLTLNGCIWIAAAFTNGTDAWTIFLTIGRAAGTALLETGALTVLGGLVLVGAAAVYGLQRLLGSEEESWR